MWRRGAEASRECMPQRRRRPVPVLLLICAGVLLCSCSGCCATTLGAQTFPILIGQSPLIFWGNRTEATITAILPCQSGVALSSKPGGFNFSIGESSAQTSTVRVQYEDAQGQEQIGQTVVCTTFEDKVAVGDSLSVIFRPGDPQDILLDKDRSLYQTLAVTTWVGAILLLVIAILLVRALYALLIRPYPSGGGVISTDGPDSTLQQPTIARLAQQAVGSSNYPTRQIRLKEALLLLHLRQTSSSVEDERFLKTYAAQLRDQFVIAAMMLELLLNGKIAVRQAGRLRKAAHIDVLDSTPLGDPDTDDVLAELSAAGGLHGSRLRHFYIQYSHRRRLTARLIDQLRRGGYVSLHIPTTGRFAQRRGQSPSLIGRIATQLLAPLGFNHGSVVATDDFTQALPWQYLYTTHTEAEERMFGRVQDAIAMRTVTDDFTRNLLILVAAHYLYINPFSRRLSARYNLYRFYSPEEQRTIHAFLCQVANQSSEGEHALYRLAREVDDHLENPPSG